MICFQSMLTPEKIHYVEHSTIRQNESQVEDDSPMQTFAERLKNCREEKGLTKKALAKLAGVKSPSTLTEMENGENHNSPQIPAIANALGVEALWLQHGAGPKLPRNLRIEDVGTSIPHQDDYATIDQFHVNGSCGDGYLNDHVEVKGSMAFKRDWLARMNIDPAQAGVIYAKGDSMTPTIQDGEVLLVDYRQREAQGNRVYVLNIDGHLLVKRLIRRVAGWMIVSDNQDKTRYPDEVVQSPDLINIVGRVVWRGGGL